MASPKKKAVQTTETKRKSTKSSKTKRLKKTSWHFPEEVTSLILGSISIFILFMLTFSSRPELIGQWGVSIGSFINQVFGLSGYLLVPLFIGLAFLSWNKMVTFKILSEGTCLFLNIILLTELFLHNGGFIGKAGIGFISTYLGIYGAGLLLITLAIINFISLTGFRLASLFFFTRILFFLMYYLIKVMRKSVILTYKNMVSIIEWILYVEDDEEDDEEEEVVPEEKSPVSKLTELIKRDIYAYLEENIIKDKKNDLSEKKEEIVSEKKEEVISEKKEEVASDKKEEVISEKTDVSDELCESLSDVKIDTVEFPMPPTVKDIEDTFSRNDEMKNLSDLSGLNPSGEVTQGNDTVEERQFNLKKKILDMDMEAHVEDGYEEGFDEEDDCSDEEGFYHDESPPKELELPPLSLFQELEPAEQNVEPVDDGIGSMLEETLASFGVQAKVVHQQIGPSITRYELQPAKGVRVNKITCLADDIALSLAALSVRLEAPIPGKSAIGIEIPNKKPQSVYLGSLLSHPTFQNSPSKLAIAFGKDITGNPVIGDLAKMPHLLIAGATGAGKSVCLNTIVASILFKAKPNEVHFAMIDPKRVELSVYKTIPHLVSINKEHRVVVSPAEASELLDCVVREMDDRYRLLAENRVRNISEFNALDPSRIRVPSDIQEGEGHLVGIESKFPMPYIVVIIDELADLMMVAPGEVEKSICRLAQLARAVGIHLVVATQRPSVNVITGIIKANIPSRISFAVSSQVDSRTILDMVGAEKLIGKGDMLYLPAGSLKPQRVQGAYVSLEAIESLIQFWETQSPPENLTDFRVDLNKKEEEKSLEEFEDELLPEAIDIVLASGSASVSQLQRGMKVGHARAGRLIDAMEKLKIVGPWEGSKPRKILVNDNPFKAGNKVQDLDDYDDYDEDLEE